MEKRLYISVILPLKLEWEPCYFVRASARIGQRVRVNFAGKEYIGVISGVGITQETAPEKIKEICGFEEGMGRIMPEEIELWKQISEYYLCSVGEVYKAAYPQRKINLEEARAVALQKAQERHERMLNAMREKIARLKGKLEDKEKALENAKPGTKKREQIEGMAERLAKEVSIAETALAHAETAAQAGILDADTEQNEPDVTLTSAQEKAYNQTTESLKANKPVMLHGVTGSGKTEIYLRKWIEIHCAFW